MSLEKISELLKAARSESPEYDTFVKDDPISAFLSLEAANKATPLDLDRMLDQEMDNYSEAIPAGRAE